MQDLQQYGAWRAQVAVTLENYGAALREAGSIDAAGEQLLSRALGRLRDDRLTVAFVAEFSRGKTELINALFFANYGQRILPSSAGRTTMCPTELLWDASMPPCIRLLPIETRSSQMSTGDFRDEPDIWTVIPLDLESAPAMQAAFRQVSQTRRVQVAEAELYGLYDRDDPEMASHVEPDGMIEIPQWRHAIINLPHPLLEQGLVILDTPGLNAIGTEPELTLNMIPNAHAVLFVLAAETGVTKSDIDVWRTHIGAGPGRLAVLNKIDAMWDELRTVEAVDADITRQQNDVARLLGLGAAQVYPVSAQKALVARIGGDKALYERSRLGALETALFHHMIPARRQIVERQLRADLETLAAGQQLLLATRLRSMVEQLQELRSLRGKNQSMISHMVRRVEAEKKEFDAGLFKLQGTRAVFNRLSTELYTLLGLDVLQDRTETVRAAMQAARFATGMRSPVRNYFDGARASLDAANAKVDEIKTMMDAMQRKFAADHGLTLSPPPALSLARHRAEIDAVEVLFDRQFGTATMLMNSRATLLERFFDSIASRLRRVLRTANADVEAWLKIVNSPLEGQIRQHRDALRQRQASVQRIHDASDSLEQKISSFEESQAEIEAARARLAMVAASVAATLGAPEAETAAA